MLGSLILYLKGMRIMMFQLSGFYYTSNRTPARGLRVQAHLLRSRSVGFATVGCSHPDLYATLAALGFRAGSTIVATPGGQWARAVNSHQQIERILISDERIPEHQWTKTLRNESEPCLNTHSSNRVDYIKRRSSHARGSSFRFGVGHRPMKKEC